MICQLGQKNVKLCEALNQEGSLSRTQEDLLQLYMQGQKKRLCVNDLADDLLGVQESMRKAAVKSCHHKL